MALFTDQADVSVRPAVVGDEHTIAAIQLATWQVTHADVLGADTLAALDPTDFADRWARAITAPPGPGFRVLVACEGAQVVGFAAVAPVPAGAGTEGSDRPERPEQPPELAGEIVALEVAPTAQRAGHGSRLLAAAVDHLREDHVTTVLTWVLDGDQGRARFLDSAGLAPDEAIRVLDGGPAADGSPRAVTEHRWSALI
ncbi:N-acetyltransferase family protein [Cellulomonas hominis]